MDRQWRTHRERRRRHSGRIFRSVLERAVSFVSKARESGYGGVLYHDGRRFVERVVMGDARVFEDNGLERFVWKVDRRVLS